MNKDTGYFHTDWAAMTVNDWAGLIVTVVVAVVMVVAYVLVFHPKNKEGLESQRYLVDGVEGESGPTENRLHGENK